MPPELGIPPSASTVSVSIIDTTGRVYGVPSSWLFTPQHKGLETLNCVCYSFLVQHPVLGRSVVFDLGTRKDSGNLSPATLRMLASVPGARFVAAKNVVDILSEHGVDPRSVEAVIWSHTHTDHVGDPSSFPASTALVVGPGFAAHHMPGYPADPQGLILEADYAGRELRELAPAQFALRVGRLPAHDYFGDGSFYLLDAPGHEMGHMMALARVTAGPDSFILMAGDAAHHGAELRPSPWLPLPPEIAPHPFTDSPDSPLRTDGVFDAVLQTGPDGTPDRARPILWPGEGTSHRDIQEAARTVAKLQEVDACDNVLVVLAHDNHLMDLLDFFPATSNDFMQKRLVTRGRWRFLKDLSQAVGWPGSVAGRPNLGEQPS